MATRTRVAATALLMLVFATPALPCDSVRGTSSPLQLVKEADVVVHVKAARHLPSPSQGSANANHVEFVDQLGHVIFELVAVHKRVVAEPELRIKGGLIETDDFNAGTIPYDSNRPSGRSGPCYAYGYRIGSEYLLLLKRDAQNALTPYWDILAPTNEQVRGKTDPWVRWVERQLRQK